MKFFLNEKNYLCLNCNLRVCLDRIYFAEIENWKYCNKIIFKCMNSAVGLILNEKVTEKWNLWVHKQCTDTLFKDKKSTSAATKKKKKKIAETRWKQNVDAISQIQTLLESWILIRMILSLFLKQKQKNDIECKWKFEQWPNKVLIYYYYLFCSNGLIRWFS